VGDALSPHWLLYGDNAMTPWARAVALTWDKKGARARPTPGDTRDLSKAPRLDLRVIAAGKAKNQTFDVVLTDVKGRTLTLTPERHAEVMPSFAGMGPRLWAQTVRVDLPKKAKKFNLTKVTSLTIKATSAKGSLFVLDAFTSRRAQPTPVPARAVPRFEVRDSSALVSENPSGVQKVDVTIAVKGKSAKASRLALTIASATGEYTQRVVRVPAGTSSVKVPLTVPADGV